MSAQEFNIRIEARNAKQQRVIAGILDGLQRDFPEVNVRIEPESKELVPEEVVLLVFVTVASEVLAAVVLGFLDKFWSHLKNKGISPVLSGMDSVQREAENYLLNIGIFDFKIIKREDRGLYVFFQFKSKAAVHHLYISRSDMKIIKYERVAR